MGKPVPPPKDVGKILKKKAQASSTGGVPPWSLGALGAAILAALAYSRLPATRLQSGTTASQEEAEAVPDILTKVRGKLLSENGGSAFELPKDERGRFADVNFWDERYGKEEEPYDWYGTWSTPGTMQVKEFIAPYLPAPAPAVRVLNIGCGSSRIAGELSNEGYGNITNVDISAVAIEKMSQKFSGNSGMRFLQMDITQMQFANASFDIVFDKGTLDALYTGSSEMVEVAVQEVFRVLAPKGVFVSMTFGIPRMRTQLNTTGVSGKNKTGEGKPLGWSSYTPIAIRKDDSGRYMSGPVEERSADSKRAPFYVYVMTK